ncbi:MAG TPA: choice-of-anchor tandem repeat GloVer-containing protein [Candidatus Baltobacteraceae bacterium]|nr:choice-of-anchor tandem repeat GloVer-containing protein [Candidatus Baltobacteraceae bacterium]
MINNKHSRKLAAPSRACNLLALFMLATLLAASATAQTLTVLRSFNAAANTTGSTPMSPLILGPGNTLYGTATGGGLGASGVVFKVQTDGGGFTVLWNFSGGSDGANPVAGLLLSGSTLYGTTQSGGLGFGTVFALNTDGSGFTNLYSFTGGSDGANPTASVVLSGDRLYGTAFNGGSSGFGTVFALDTNGSGFTNLYSFKGGLDCGNPYAELLLSGGTLYGTTTGSNAAIADFGSVFRINTNGSGFAVLKTFVGSEDFGNPFGGLVISGSTLYGTTEHGNNNKGYGTVFEINTNGGSFATLHAFDFTDGNGPYGTLVLSAGTLYGTTFEGGSEDSGTVFSIAASGGSFTTLSSLTNGIGGVFPYGGLVLSGSTLYGTTAYGGANGYGMLFEVNTSGSNFISLTSFSGDIGAVTPAAPLVFSGNTLYGTTTGGGSSGYGTVFEVNLDGSGIAVLKSFSDANGSYPNAGLALSGNTLYGTTTQGGSSGGGTVFEVNLDGSGFAVLKSFSGANGEFPVAGLALSGGVLYGTTSQGGAIGYGTVFEINTNGSGFATLHSFAGYPSGANPDAGLTLGSDGNFYGTTYGGGISNYGTVFRMTTHGTLTTLVSFANTNGAYPQAGLALDNYGNFYGTTYSGGSSGDGTVFRLTTNGALSTLVSFAGTNGENPYAGLTLGSDGNFYGTTYGGGSSDYGTVFQMTTNGTLATLVSFAFTNGSSPQAVLTLDSYGNFYGTTSRSGSGEAGTVFRLNVVPGFQAVTLTHSTLSLTWSTVVGWKYQLQYNSDLSPTNWNNLNSPVTATGPTLSTTDSITNGPQRFYRVMILP